MNALKIGSTMESLGRALVPMQQSRVRPSSSYIEGTDLMALDAHRTREQAEALWWRATQARREARELGRVAGAVIALGAAVWYQRSRK